MKKNLVLEIFLFSLVFHDTLFKIRTRLNRLFKKSKKQKDQDWPLFI